MLFVLIFIRLITDLIDAPLYYFLGDPVLFRLIVIFTFAVLFAQKFMDLDIFGKK